MKIGFVSVRFAGLDGVSLEASKVADVLRSAGHEVVWFAGELGAEFSPGMQFAPARFNSVENLELQDRCFGVERTPPAVVDVLQARATEVEEAIREFMTSHGVEALIPENSSSIPMQMPLGVALARLAREGVPMVAHHHDFGWERERFHPTGIADLVQSSFPPVAPNVQHLVINSIAQRELAKRTGAASTVLPNVMDFEHPPPPGDGALFRRYSGLDPTDIVLLQPTRIIPRKSIELTLDLAARLSDPAVKVIATHPDLDEGGGYADLLFRLATDLGVDYRLAAVGGGGQPSLADAYAAADLVTYPSRIEGFGNALLEAIYYGCPVLINRYPVYVADIAPTGLDLVEIDGEITSESLAQVEQLLGNATLRDTAASSNYETCVEHFSYAVVRRRVLPLFEV